MWMVLAIGMVLVGVGTMAMLREAGMIEREGKVSLRALENGRKAADSYEKNLRKEREAEAAERDMKERLDEGRGWIHSAFMLTPPK